MNPAPPVISTRSVIAPPQGLFERDSIMPTARLGGNRFDGGLENEGGPDAGGHADSADSAHHEDHTCRPGVDRQPPRRGSSLYPHLLARPPVPDALLVHR